MINLRIGFRSQRCPSRAYEFDGFGLTRAGSLRLVETDATCCFVYKLDAGAPYVESVLLDSGADIDPTSFAVGGKHIYWTKAGAPQSATMP